MSAVDEVPRQTRLQLAHAALQVVAQRSGVDVLHIKGEALDADVRWPGRQSTDADILVRPRQVATMLRALSQSGWSQVAGFASSSAFEHSATLTHPVWGYADVHRRYPGFTVSDDDGFDQLWRAKREWHCAGTSCAVPDLAGQRLVILLHAARSHASTRRDWDIARAWTDVSSQDQAQVTTLAGSLGAHVGLAAATGTLDDWADAPEHDLWHVLSAGGTRVDEWRARIKATPRVRAKARLVLRVALVNVEHLTMVRGTKPSPAAVVVEFFARPARGAREELRRLRSR